MKLTSLYPVLMSHDVSTAAEFYTSKLGFAVRFESDWYVSLAHGDQELAILAAHHPTVPAGFGTVSRGLLINFEVEDVDAVYADLVMRQGLRPVLDIRSEDFGQRHFILRGPDDVLLDVITPIAMTGEYAAMDEGT